MQPLPSRKKHALLVTSTLAVIIGTVTIATNFLGRADDARSAGVITIPPPPLPPASDTLEASSNALPDLLAGEVKENVNPTEALSEETIAKAQEETIAKAQTDALGNPLASSPNSESVTLPSVPITTPSSPSFTPSTTGPQVIMIDGKPIDGSGEALVPAPISGLTKLSSYGQVPAISPAGVTPLSAYKRPFTPVSGTKTVSIIIGGLSLIHI